MLSPHFDINVFLHVISVHLCAYIQACKCRYMYPVFLDLVVVLMTHHPSETCYLFPIYHSVLMVFALHLFFSTLVKQWNQ